MEKQDELLSSVAAQDMDTSGYQLFDLEDFEFHGKHPDLNMDAPFRPVIVTSFRPSTLHKFQMGSMVDNPILIDEERDKGNSHPLPTTAVSERLTHPPVLRKNCPFGTKNKNARKYVYKELFG